VCEQRSACRQCVEVQHDGQRGCGRAARTGRARCHVGTLPAAMLALVRVTCVIWEIGVGGSGCVIDV